MQYDRALFFDVSMLVLQLLSCQFPMAVWRVVDTRKPRDRGTTSRERNSVNSYSANPVAFPLHRVLERMS
jgi:hypothetical protein